MKQLKLVFVCEQIKAQQVIPDKVKRAFVESFCNHSPSLPLNIKQFSSESLWKPSYIWRYKLWVCKAFYLMASKCRWMGTLTGRLVASRKSVHRFRFTILVWVRLTCGGEENNNLELFFISHLFVGGGERQIVACWRVQHLSTNKRNPSLFIPTCLLIKGYFDLALPVQPPKLRGEGQIMPNSAARGGRI